MRGREELSFFPLGVTGWTLVFGVLGKTAQHRELTASDCSIIDALESTQERKNYRDMSTLGVCYLSQGKESSFHSWKIPVLLKDHR